jgi:hypothetical protein
MKSTEMTIFYNSKIHYKPQTFNQQSFSQNLITSEKQTKALNIYIYPQNKATTR